MKTFTKLLLAAMLLTTSSAIIAMDINDATTDMEIVQTEEASGAEPLEKKRSLSESTSEETDQPQAPHKKLKARRPASPSTTNQLITDTTIIDPTANTTVEEPLDKIRSLDEEIDQQQAPRQSRFAPAFEETFKIKKPKTTDIAAAISHATTLAQGAPLSRQDCAELEAYIAQATALFKEGGKAHCQVSTAFAPLHARIKDQLDAMDKVTDQIVASSEAHAPAITPENDIELTNLSTKPNNLAAATDKLKTEIETAKNTTQSNPARGWLQFQEALSKFARTNYSAACTTAAALASSVGAYASFHAMDMTSTTLEAHELIPDGLTVAAQYPMMGAAFGIGIAGYALARKFNNKIYPLRNGQPTTIEENINESK